MVAELRPPGADKGDALSALMREPPFAGARPVFVGDDLTDEHAFQAAAVLGGAGVLVGPPRETAARYGLAGVAEVAEWLRAAA
jgi:trehalose 6-phosphate phosphatase